MKKESDNNAGGKSGDGICSNVNTESLQKELDLIRKLLRMQKERKSTDSSSRRASKDVPTPTPPLINPSPPLLISPPIERKSLLSMLSHRSNSNCARPKTSPPFLTTPLRTTLSSRSLDCSAKGHTQRKRPSCKSADIDSASPLSGLQTVTLEKSRR